MNETAAHSPLSLLLSWKVWACLLALYLVGHCVYNLCFHPLAPYPGPWYAGVSKLWMFHHFHKGDLHVVTKALHERHGPVVRIASDELSYTTPNAWKDIYGHRVGKSENEKDPAYRWDPDPQHPNIITADRERHSQLRRILSNAFSDKVLREQEPIMSHYVDLLISRLQEKCEKNDNVVDIVEWYNFTTFDIIGQLAFAESFDCLQSSAYHPWVKLMFASLKHKNCSTLR